jgi:chromosome partitioning protein
MEQIKSSGANKKLKLGGIIMTMFDGRTKLSEQVVTEVRGHFKKESFKTVIPRSIRLGEAPSFGQTIFDYDNYSAGAKAYRSLTKEVIKRFGLK